MVSGCDSDRVAIGLLPVERSLEVEDPGAREDSEEPLELRVEDTVADSSIVPRIIIRGMDLLFPRNIPSKSCLPPSRNKSLLSEAVALTSVMCELTGRDSETVIMYLSWSKVGWQSGRGKGH